MDPATLAFIQFGIDTTIKYGVPAYLAAVQTLDASTPPSIEQIHALQSALADPESFFHTTA